MTQSLGSPRSNALSLGGDVQQHLEQSSDLLVGWLVVKSLSLFLEQQQQRQQPSLPSRPFSSPMQYQ
jgi:hypothetical protein